MTVVSTSKAELISRDVVPSVELMMRVHEVDPSGIPTSTTRMTTIDVVRHSGFGTPVEWVTLGNDDHQIELSLESARALLRALTTTVAPA